MEEHDVIAKNEKKTFIKSQPFFSQLTDEEIDLLAPLFVEKHITSGTTIVTEGDPVDSVYLIAKGNADVQHITMKDRIPQIQSVATLSDGASIGLSATGFYSLSGVRTATVVAIDNMILLRLSLAAFQGFKLANPRISDLMRQQNVFKVDQQN